MMRGATDDGHERAQKTTPRARRPAHRASKPVGGMELLAHRKQRFLNAGRIVQELRSMWQIAALRDV